MKVEASVVKGVKRQRESAAPDADEPERKNMKRPKNQARRIVHFYLDLVANEIKTKHLKLYGAIRLVCVEIEPCKEKNVTSGRKRKIIY